MFNRHDHFRYWSPLPSDLNRQMAQACAFATGLDQAVLRLLASLNTHRYWDSLRNYNRIAAQPDPVRERRLQALTRFPVLVAPVLLSAHHSLRAEGGERHAWRAHDDKIVTAVEQGRDQERAEKEALLAELARLRGE